MGITNIMECQCCGNRNAKSFRQHDRGYICSCCGVAFYLENDEKVSDDEKSRVARGYANLKNYEFSKARYAFMDVLADYPKSIDARWGLLLAKYGVVFIKGFFDGVVEPIYCFPEYDELSNKMFRGEKEYGEILELIEDDEDLVDFYEKKSRKIDTAIRKFRECKNDIERDVFLCVKISSATERDPEAPGRTEDYEYAQKIYNDLRAKGLNVFFSFVTLHNEVQSDHEIWLNLVKSKKMLLIGSREEYIESAWVKSEWKRWFFLNRHDDMYICSMRHDYQNPKSILPHELRTTQIYTLDTYDKLISDISGETAAAEERARIEAEERAKKAEELRKQAEIEDRLRWEEEMKAQFQAQLKAQAEAMEKMKAEMEAKAKAEAEAKAKAEAEAKAKAEAEAKAKAEAEAKAKAKAEAEAKAKAEAEAKAKAEAEAKAKAEAEAKAKAEAEAKAKAEAEAKAKAEAEAKAKAKAEAKAKANVTIKFSKCPACENSQKSKFTVRGHDILSCQNCGVWITNSEEPKMLKCKICGNGDCFTMNQQGDNAICAICGMTDCFDNAIKIPAQTTPMKDGKIIYKDGRYKSGKREEILKYGITEIPERAYYGNEKIMSMVLPGSVTTIGKYAFGECRGLEKLTIPSGVKNISDGAFSFCTALTEVTLPEGIKEISQNAFWNCVALKNVSIPNGVEKIRTNAFSGCKGLAAITLPATLKTIDGRAFDTLTNIKDAYYGGTKEQWQAVSVGNYNGSLTNAVFHFENEGEAIAESAIKAPEGKDGKIVYADGTEKAIAYGITEITSDDYSQNNDIVSVVLPESVTKIGAFAFEQCESLESVTIPLGVTYLGEMAFVQCDSLEEIVIPDSVTEIGNYAFGLCQNLRNVVLPKNLEIISQELFTDCYSLEKVMIPENVTAIEREAFHMCQELTSINIPASVKSIGDEAFEGCPIDEIYYGGTEKQWQAISIGKDNEALTKAVIHFVEESASPAKPTAEAAVNQDGKIVYKDGRVEVLKYGITEIEKQAYIRNKEIVSVVLPESVTTIGASAFWECKNLESVSIPSKVTVIDYGVFYGCEKLKGLTLPDGLTKIGARSFMGCAALADINIPKSVTAIGESSFNGCKQLKSITIPEGVTEIEGWTFGECAGLASISLPSTLAKMARNPFYGCKAKFVLSPQNRHFKLVDNNLYSADLKTLVAFIPQENQKIFYIPDGVTTILKNAFSICKTLESVYIPKSVTGIESYAFSTCDSLKEIHYSGSEAEWKKIKTESDGNSNFIAAAKYFWTVPENLKPAAKVSAKKESSSPVAKAPVNQDGKAVYKGGKIEVLKYGIKEIAKNAYYNNKDITSIVLPESVETIGSCAFWGCNSLESVVLSGKLKTIEAHAFCFSAIKNIEIPKGLTTIGLSAFHSCGMLENVTIPSSVTSIDGGVFSGCMKLKISVSPESKVYKVIDNNLYKENYNLLLARKEMNIVQYMPKKGETSFKIPDGITTIEKYAFSCAGELREITVPESVDYIGANAFNNCYELTSVSLPRRMSAMGNNAFDGCFKLKKLIIPDGVTEIREYMFSYCYALESVSLPGSVTKIRRCIFSGCNNLKEIYYGGSRSDWKRIEIEKDNPKLTGIFGKATVHYNGR